ncbi:hypothetical protein [Mycolicibacterium confluentis]|uniref:hypothetical protein n=1 Tax=Mycolicibacterium confluentis TaxID=28047 RepID=UPI000A258A76|nr:hypothetical protein [Mycolicibacterium confluentis]MCV7322172.1 hypothetical protein [Mycolicibacterium confluentis]ORV31509.1 hypothetical protein AWB99_11975 [Mycolicibacterium confluentis]
MTSDEKAAVAEQFGVANYESGDAIVTVVNNRFWRLEPACGIEPAVILDSPVLTEPAELISKIKRLDGVVIGTWHPDTEQGRVHALGVVQKVDGRSAVIDWRRANFTLRPTGPGATQWKTRPFFRFKDLVATRYRLMDHFHGAFATNEGGIGTPTWSTGETTPPVMAATNPQRTEPLADSTAALEATGPQCNRVAPDGEVFSTPQRGMFMGNRTSPPRWLICDLHFKRDLSAPRKYTKLFFLDEAVALAAGHRPCNTCRRDRYQEFLATVGRDIAVSGAGHLDAVLNAARKNAHRRSTFASLPDGAFVKLNEGDYRLKWCGALHRWTPPVVMSIELLWRTFTLTRRSF